MNHPVRVPGESPGLGPIEAAGSVYETNSTSRPANILELQDVHKRYASTEVLTGLSLTVRQGEVLGFLGKNGAGKSTAMRAVMGIVGIDSGQVSLFGQALQKDVIGLRQRIGYVAQEQHFYPWMTPLKLGAFVAGFYPRWDAKRYQALLLQFGLPEKKRCGTFSGGMKAKLALALALACAPELLLLDEPTAGMDPIARREFLTLVRQQTHDSGAAVFFSTHLIDDIETLSDRIAVIDRGQALYEGDLQQFSNSIACYSIDLMRPAATLPIVELAPQALRCLSDTTERRQRSVILQFPSGQMPGVVAGSGWRHRRLSLEDIFIALVSAES